MMRAIYRAYCRSVTQASCNPGAIGIGLAVLVLAYLAHGLIGTVIAHESAIVHGFLVAAATILSCVAGLLLIQAMRTIVRAVGTHVSPACPVPVRAKPATAAAPAGTVPLGVRRDGTPVTADVPAGSWTWKIRPPAGERLPGKSDLITGGKLDRPVPVLKDMAGMHADANALRDGDLDFAVHHGDIYEMAGDGQDEP
jgi:hypothetical protein